MAKRFGYRTAIAGLTALALTTSTVVSPQNFALAEDTSVDTSDEDNADTSDGDNTGAPADGNTQGGSSETKELTEEQKGGIAGIVLSIGALIGALAPIPGIQEANTNLQKQLGIFNPQLAGIAAKAVRPLGIIVGLTGLILSSLFAANKLEVMKTTNGEGKESSSLKIKQ